MVYVQNINRKPLMPCTEAKARHLLEERKAVIVNYTPFTIRLNFVVDDITQPVTLGVDAGYKSIGISATTESKVLFEAEVELRDDVTKLLTARREFRRSRRNRKTRHRAPRFNNRSRPAGWHSPSVENRIGTHLAVIDKVCKLLPVTRIVVEVAAFDIQKINNPDIEGVEYQRGEQYGYENVKAYVRERDNCTCRYCHGKTKDVRLRVHHIQHRADGGPDRPSNLITLCATCHDRYHNGEITLSGIKPGKGFKSAAFMTSTRWTLVNRLKAKYGDEMVSVTYGYLTKCEREKARLEKAHYADARCISGNPTAEPNGKVWQMTKHRCHNRQIHKCTILKGGVRKLNQCPRKVYGFGLFDKVMYNGELCYIHARRTSGYFDIRKFDRTRLSAGMSYRQLRLIRHSRNLDIR